MAAFNSLVFLNLIDLKYYSVSIKLHNSNARYGDK